MNTEIKDSIREEIQKKANVFDLLESHKLLKISYILRLTDMKSTFKEMSINCNDSFLVCIKF